MPTLRPELLALRPFGALSYDDPREDEWWPLLHALVCSKEPLNDAEVAEVVGLLEIDGGTDLYGACFCLLDMVEQSPGFPQNVQRLGLTDEGLWHFALLDRANARRA